MFWFGDKAQGYQVHISLLGSGLDGSKTSIAAYKRARKLGLFPIARPFVECGTRGLGNPQRTLGATNADAYQR